MTSIRISILIILFVLFASPAIPAWGGESLPFDIVIIEADSNRAIPAARLMLQRLQPARPVWKRELSTDAGGKARLQLRPGTYRLKAGSQGFATDETRIIIPQADSANTIKLGLQKESTITGRLLDRDGRPLPGLTVSSGKESGKSDNNGRFLLGGLGRSYLDLTILHPELVFSQAITLTISPGEKRDLGDLQVRKGGILRATVTGMEKTRKEPLARLPMSLYGKQNDRSGITDSKGEITFAPLPPGIYNISSYDERILALSTREIELQEGENRVRLEAVLRPPEVFIADFGDVLLPDKAVKLRISGFRLKSAEVTLSALDPALLVTGSPALEGVSSFPRDKFSKLTSFTVKLKGNRNNLQTRATTKLPPLKPGVYLLEVNEPGQSIKTQSETKKAARHHSSSAVAFLVTRLALVAKSAPSGTVIYATDLASGKALGNVDISAYPLKGGNQDPDSSVSTAVDGLAAITIPAGGVQLVGRWQGNLALLPLTAEQQRKTAGNKGYIYTDRPAYRPGQSLYFKGIVRQQKGEGYQLPKSGNIRVTISDSNNQKLFEKELALSATGSFNGEFAIPVKPALGEYEITASAGGQNWQAGFKVLEYRKPEFEVITTQPQKFVLAGDQAQVKVRARYYFGAPVVGADVRYRVYARRLQGFGAGEERDEESGEENDYSGGYAEFLGEGEAKTDPDGSAAIPLETRPTSTPLAYTVEFDVIDQSSRQVSASTGFAVVPALIDVSVTAATYLGAPGVPVDFTIRTASWEGVPVAAKLQVKVEEQRYDKLSRSYTYHPIDTLQVATDVTGRGNLRYSFPRSGNWRLTATTSDNRGKLARGEGWLWVWREGHAWDNSYRDLTLELDKKNYRPDDTARLLVKNPGGEGDLLLAVEGGDLYSRQVVPLKSSVEVINLPVAKEYAPYVFITATLIHQGRFHSSSRRLIVEHKPDSLKLNITPDKPLYQPGETVRLDLSASDNDNRARQAELSLGVVDEAIYAVARERSDDIYKFFRGTREHLVTTLHSFPRVYLGGAAKGEAKSVADKATSNRIRRVFKDTAFWLPVLQTDKDGKASAEFILPDNLTTWRATAIGQTTASEFGTGRAKFIARLDLMARLMPPRFLVQGDELKIPALINNVSEQQKSIQGRFSVANLAIIGDPAFTASVPAGGSLRQELAIRSVKSGEAIIRLEASAGSQGDAMELAIPVLPRGIKRQSVGNIVLREGEGETSVLFPAEGSADNANLSITFAPSLFTSLQQSLRELVAFPYGCVEQTLSRFLPALYVEQLGKKGDWTLEKDIVDRLPQVIEAGLARLYDFQHSDGGWGWWKEDATDPDMTAYVIYGLALAKKVGLAVKQDAYERGVKSLLALVEKSLASRLPFAYRSLTMGGVADNRAEAEIERYWPNYQPSEKMLYIEALSNRGEVERARRLLAEVKGGVQREGGAAWLKDNDADSWWYSPRWAGSAVETTAMLLETMQRLEPNDPLNPALAEFLIRRRAGRWWNTTRATAMVVKALAEYSGESGNYSARLLLNGKELERYVVKEGRLISGRSDINIPGIELQRGAQRLTLSKSEPGGAAHLTAQLDYVVPAEMSSNTPGLTIERQLFRLKSRRDNDKWRMERHQIRADEPLTKGEDIEVRLVIENKNPLDYVIVEDPLPAGFEVRETRGDSRFADYAGYGDWYTHQERHDEKMAFFINQLSAGRHEFRYVVHPELEGGLMALPATVWPMYMPTIRAESSPWPARVTGK